MNKDVMVYLRHIVEAIEHIQEFIQGMDYEAFDSNYMVQSAVIRQFEIIGEAATRALKTDSELIEKLPQVPWRDMIDMRNVLIHDYAGVQVEIVWDTIHKDLIQVYQPIKEYLHAL